MIEFLQGPIPLIIITALVFATVLLMIKPVAMLFCSADAYDKGYVIKKAIPSLISAFLAGVFIIAVVATKKQLKSLPSFEPCNCRYTDLGDSHEYTEFDENNEMVWSMEFSHNYNEDGVCINCGHECTNLE